MGKVRRVFRFVSWAMLFVGVFSIVTGIITLLGFSEAISDSMGNRVLFTFINGGAYFMICGAIHIGAGLIGLGYFTSRTTSTTCMLTGMFTIVWQLTAFIYMLTLRFISIRLACMLILPIVYVALLIPIQLVESSSLQKVTSDTDFSKPHKAFVAKRIFSNFKFSFKRKSFITPQARHSTKTFHINRLFQPTGKRRSTNILSFLTFRGKRRNRRSARMRKFTRR